MVKYGDGRAGVGCGVVGWVRARSVAGGWVGGRGGGNGGGGRESSYS